MPDIKNYDSGKLVHEPDRASRGISRRDTLIASLGLVSLSSFASNYPKRQISLIVGGPPGGGIDIGTRVISQPLSELLGVPVIIEYKPGATGVISTKYVASAAADGYTFLMATPSATVVGPQSLPSGAFNPLVKGIVGVNMVTKNPFCLAVNPSLKVDSLKSLVALSKERPITLGTAGRGGASDLVVKELAKLTGGRFEVIPYTGAAPAIVDALGGQIDGVGGELGPVLSFYRDKKLNLVTVTAETRVPSAPNVPVTAETYPGFSVNNWLGIFAPAKTPTDILNTFNAALLKVLDQDQVKAAFAPYGNTVSPMAGPVEFQKFSLSQYDYWGKVLREHGFIKT